MTAFKSKQLLGRFELFSRADTEKMETFTWRSSPLKWATLRRFLMRVYSANSNKLMWKSGMRIL